MKAQIRSKLVVALSLSTCILGILLYLSTVCVTLYCRAGIYFGLVVVILYFLITVHILAIVADPTFSFLGVYMMYVYRITLHVASGLFAIRADQVCKSHIQDIQRDTLRAILRKHENTKFATDHNIRGSNNVSEYIENVPMSSYKEVEHYYRLIYENNEQDILFPGKADAIITTSGTTGKNKLYALKQAWLKKLFSAIAYSSIKIEKDLKFKHSFQKLAYVRVASKPKTTAHGVYLGPLTGWPRLPYDIYTTPSCVSKHVFNETESMYINALMLLSRDNVEKLDSLFPSNAISFMNTIEKYRDELAFDIENGKINSVKMIVDVEEQVLNEINSQLFPNPRRASQIRKELAKGSTNLIPRLWPEIKWVYMISSGCFQSATDYFRHKYLNPTIICQASLYRSSEGGQGFSTDVTKNEAAYMPLVDLTFYEFIDQTESHDEEPPPILLHEVQAGHTYELVITNYWGMYRYRLGDCVKIVGFESNLPLMQFSHRLGHVLTVHSEKLSEYVIQTAVNNMSKDLSDRVIVEYTCTEGMNYNDFIGDDSNNGKFYVVFMEFTSEDDLPDVLPSVLDAKLMETSEKYNEFRLAGRIKPLKILHMRKDTFVEFKSYILKTNSLTSNFQFKIPKAVRSEAHLRFFLEHVVKRNNLHP